MQSNTAQTRRDATATVETLDIAAYVRQVGQTARAAAILSAKADTASKNRALTAIAEQVLANQQTLLRANAKDLAAAQQNQLSPALLDRLELTPARINAMAKSCQQIAQLADPVGATTELTTRPSGIKIGKMRVPLGVLGIIYESRPNVTLDAAALCLKAGNAVILRGGSEALHSNVAIADCIYAGLKQADLPVTGVQLITVTDRAAVRALITLADCIDVLIPRGGLGLIQHISQHARIPVLKHLQGICHVYIDEYADHDKAIRVAYNAKARRYGVCGAMETLLVAASQTRVLPPLYEKYTAKGIELRGCARTRRILPHINAASEADWGSEYLDAVLSIRIVDGLAAALQHIATYGSQHTDAIVTENQQHQQRFLREVDSSSVMVNASTQFADGFEYGLGAEIGISTDKLHVRGPVGLEGLTCQKYIVIGDGSIRA